MWTSQLLPKLKASGLHLACSALLACVAAWMVFGVWYRAPYGQLSGATDLFLLMVGVDIALGPLATLVVFSTTKARKKLLFDLVMIASVQLAALGYGVWTVYLARPVHMVFEYDRMRVVHAVEIPVELLNKTPQGIVAMPVWGPTLLGLRPFKDNDEQTAANWAAISGISISSRPELWCAYDQAVPAVLKAAKPVSQLLSKYPQFADRVQGALADAKHGVDNTVYLPLASRANFGTVLLDATTAQPLAALPLDSF